MDAKSRSDTTKLTGQMKDYSSASPSLPKTSLMTAPLLMKRSVATQARRSPLVFGDYLFERAFDGFSLGLGSEQLLGAFKFGFVERVSLLLDR